ncbi:MAG TPA: Gfo/Idh/MocA family oxidoreductase [Chloroflexota bacterium]|nr:Gfo/Idh/MocA family oxidoreductase [Chloroflexota bacterium]
MAEFSVLIVGAGQMGRAWGENLRACPDTEIVAWVDVLPGAAARAAEALGVPNALTGIDLDRAITMARPDFVVDVSSPEAHRDVTLTALARGLPVLGEKPMAATMAQAREMVAAAERAGTLYMVSQNRRYDRNLHALRRLIVEQTGPVGILNADFYMGEHYSGFRREMPSPLLVDMAIHTFDAARFLTGADALAVYCIEFNPPWSWYKGNASASAIFEMSNGAVFTYRGSRSSDGYHTSWDSRWRAVGPHGTAIWDGQGAPAAEVVAEHTEPIARFTRIEGVPDPTMAVGIARTLHEFLQALRTGETPPCECHDNIRSLAMVHAAMESAATGRRVTISV